MGETTLLSAMRETTDNYLPESGFKMPEAFSTRRFGVIDNIVRTDVLRKIVARVESGDYCQTKYKVGSELSPSNPALADLLNFMLNDPYVIARFKHLSGGGDIRFFRGRIYKLLPGAQDHGFVWHDDRDERGRKLGVSLNLSENGFKGGEFQLRRKDGPILAKFRNDRFGQAIVFQIAPDLQHRVTPLKGKRSRLVFAGWFHG